MASVQLQSYLRLRFVDGLSRGDAAFETGLSEGEAALHDADVESGELTIPEIPHRLLQEPTAGGGSNRAHAASGNGRQHPSGEGMHDDRMMRANPGTSTSNERTPAMARGRKKEADTAPANAEPNFTDAIDLLKTRIQALKEKSDSVRAELATPWNDIEKVHHVNKKAAKFFFSNVLNAAEDNAQDVLRSLFGLLNAYDVTLYDDLVDRAEGKSAMPPAARPKADNLTSIPLMN